MKTNPDHDDAPLVDAILGDEIWTAANAAWKKQALGCFRQHRQRRRRILFGSYSTVALAVLAALVASIPREHSVELVKQVVPTPHVEPRSELTLLTDEQLLSMFPNGSCVLAEIDGRTELVFLDPDVEREYFWNPAQFATP